MTEYNDNDAQDGKKTSSFLLSTFNVSLFAPPPHHIVKSLIIVFLALQIVSDPANANIVCWNDAGDEFIVKDEHQFSTEVLKDHFRHQNFSSFVRQLNFYGFRKRSTSSHHSHFKHVNFRRGRRDLLQNIKRKVAETSANNSNVKDTIENLQQQVATLQRQYEDIWKVQHHILFVLSRYMSRDSTDPRVPAQQYPQSFPYHINAPLSPALPADVPALPMLPMSGSTPMIEDASDDQPSRPTKRKSTQAQSHASTQQYTRLPSRNPYQASAGTRTAPQGDPMTWTDWQQLQSVVASLPTPANMQGFHLPPTAHGVAATGSAQYPSSTYPTRRRNSVATVEEIAQFENNNNSNTNTTPTSPPTRGGLHDASISGLGSVPSLDQHAVYTGAFRSLPHDDDHHDSGARTPIHSHVGGQHAPNGSASAFSASPSTVFFPSHGQSSSSSSTAMGMGSGMGMGMGMDARMPPSPIAPPALTFLPSDVPAPSLRGLLTYEPSADRGAVGVGAMDSPTMGATMPTMPQPQPQRLVTSLSMMADQNNNNNNSNNNNNNNASNLQLQTPVRPEGTGMRTRAASRALGAQADMAPAPGAAGAGTGSFQPFLSPLRSLGGSDDAGMGAGDAGMGSMGMNLGGAMDDDPHGLSAAFTYPSARGHP
jgi:hypothetical protein